MSEEEQIEAENSIINIGGIDVEFDDSLFDVNKIIEDAYKFNQPKKKKVLPHSDIKEEAKQAEKVVEETTGLGAIEEADSIVLVEPICFDEYPFN